MSSTDMAQDFAGISGKYGHSMNKPHISQSVHLFLPEYVPSPVHTYPTLRASTVHFSHHHVESVHFATSVGLPYHPALATVQTPGREYFILKDNGMEVGCEEDGVAPLWMEILGCDRRGLSL